MGGSSYKTKKFSESWDDVTKSLSKEDNFGKELKKNTYFKDDLAQIINNTDDDTTKINAILSFVKNKVKWNDHYGIFTNDGVKKAFKQGIGNVAEVNLILTAMLREAGLDASPILVSTRSHGKPFFPTRKGFNYVIAGVELLDKLILLDATDYYSTINVLPKRTLNWKGRIIRKTGSSAFVDLFPKVYSQNIKRLNIIIDQKGNIRGSLRSNYNNLIALRYRNSYNNLSQETLIKKLEQKYKPILIGRVKIVNKDKLNKFYTVSLQYTADNQVEIINDKMYFSSLFFIREKENYFKSNIRHFPVDFSTAWLENFNVVIKIPDNYKVENLPENILINTENGIGSFSFTSEIKETKIIVKMKTKINYAIIESEQYKELKDFYTAFILKQNEKIVLVKE